MNPKLAKRESPYRLLPAGAVAGWGFHPLEKRRLCTAHARRRHSSASPLGHSDVRSASVPANFLVRQTKKAGAWPASPDCSSAVSRPTLIRRVVPRFEARWAFEIYVRRRHFKLRLACACCAQVAVCTADSLLGLVAVVLGLLLTCLLGRVCSSRLPGCLRETRGLFQRLSRSLGVFEGIRGCRLQKLVAIPG
jgi:hypothetical protein